MNELTLTNLPGHLRIMDDLGIKPNYSQLARLYGIDRHTVAKIHKNKGTCPRKGRPKDSEWDKYEEEIFEKMNLVGINKKGLYNYLRNVHPEIKGTYSGFCDYLRRKDIRCKVSVTPHPYLCVNMNDLFMPEKNISLQKKSTTQVNTQCTLEIQLVQYLYLMTDTFVSISVPAFFLSVHPQTSEKPKFQVKHFFQYLQFFASEGL